MRIDGERLKQRRESLGYPRRELATLAGIGTSALINLETKCDPSLLQVGQLQRLLTQLGLRYDDVISDDDPVTAVPASLTKRIGAFLVAAPLPVERSVLARALSTSIEEIEHALRQLRHQLKGTGIALDDRHDGLSLVSAYVRPDVDPIKHQRERLAALNAADLDLLQQVYRRKTDLRQTSSKLGALSSLSRLRDAGLVDENAGGELALTEVALEVLGLDGPHHLLMSPLFTED